MNSQDLKVYFDSEHIQELRSAFSTLLLFMDSFLKRGFIDPFTYSVICEKVYSARDFAEYVCELANLSDSGKLQSKLYDNVFINLKNDVL